MSYRPIPSLAQPARTVFAAALVLALAACGGGMAEDPAVAPARSSAAAPPSAVAAAAAAAPGAVTVEGCVLDRHYIPTTGTPVRALSPDGRLLGNAESDAQGRFTLRLPARSQVTLQVDRPGGESLPMQVGATPSTWDTCLQDEQA